MRTCWLLKHTWEPWTLHDKTTNQPYQRLNRINQMANVIWMPSQSSGWSIDSWAITHRVIMAGLVHLVPFGGPKYHSGQTLIKFQWLKLDSDLNSSSDLEFNSRQHHKEISLVSRALSIWDQLMLENLASSFGHLSSYYCIVGYM